MSWREGSSPPTMWRAVRTTLCRALRLPAVLFPNQAVMQPVRMLSTVQDLRPIADHRKQYLPIRSPIPIFLLCRIIYSDTPIRIFWHLFRAWISFLRMNSPLRWLLWEGIFFIWGVEGAFFFTFFKNIYLSHLNVWSRSAFLFLQSCNSLHTAKPDFESCIWGGLLCQVHI